MFSATNWCEKLKSRLSGGRLKPQHLMLWYLQQLEPRKQRAFEMADPRDNSTAQTWYGHA